jgi:hypothetical protein
VKTSDLIRELQEIIDTRGDLPIKMFDGAFANEVEVIVALHRTGNRVFIAAAPVSQIAEPKPST